MDEIKPVVSVIMATYNVQEYVGEAIESILNQTLENFELIIIDDFSNDNTLNIIEEYAAKDKRIMLIKNSCRMGAAATRNKGIIKARGKYVAIMDSDDYSYPDRLQWQVNFMEANKDVILSGGSIEICDEELNPLNIRSYPVTHDVIMKNFFRYCPFGHSAVIFRASQASDILYNEAFRAAQDYDFYLKMSTLGKLANIDKALVKLRTRRTSISSGRAKEQALLTLYVRIKAICEYGYRMSFLDKCYWLVQFIAVYLVPNRLKFWVFNFFRKYFL